MPSTKPLPVSAEPVVGSAAVMVKPACAVTPEPVVTEIRPGAIAVMNSLAGRLVPVTAMPTASPAMEVTATVGLPAVVVADVVVVSPVTGTVKAVVPFTAEMV